ncbi:hypothetical protein T439DRAFT_126713 [Meredithblackwellia eburnea MCA 4105]
MAPPSPSNHTRTLFWDRKQGFNTPNLQPGNVPETILERAYYRRIMFPSLQHHSAPPLPLESTMLMFRTWSFVCWFALLLLIWDWACNITNEINLAWRMKGSTGASIRASTKYWSWNILCSPGPRAMKISFLCSRYLAIAQAIFVVMTLTTRTELACSLTRLLPFGFSVVLFSAHIVMCLRMYGLCSHSRVVLFTLVGLAVLDFGIQIVLDGLLQSIYMNVTTGDISFNGCHIMPASKVFVLAFISPSVFGHVVLLITLWVSWKHLPHERAVGGSLMKTLRRDQFFYVLSICLINFLNVILVLQDAFENYKLINYLPSMCLTQIFLGRIFFSLRRLAKAPVLVGGALSSVDISSTPGQGRKDDTPTLHHGPSFLNFGRSRSALSQTSSQTRFSVFPTSKSQQTIEIRLPPSTVIGIDTPTSSKHPRPSLPFAVSGHARNVSGYGDALAKEEKIAGAIVRKSPSMISLNRFLAERETQSPKFVLGEDSEDDMIPLETLAASRRPPPKTSQVVDNYVFPEKDSVVFPLPSPPLVPDATPVVAPVESSMEKSQPRSRRGLQSRRRSTQSQLTLVSPPHLTEFPSSNIPRRSRTHHMRESTHTPFPPIDPRQLSPPPSSRPASPPESPMVFPDPHRRNQFNPVHQPVPLPPASAELIRHHSTSSAKSSKSRAGRQSRMSAPPASRRDSEISQSSSKWDSKTLVNEGASAKIPGPLPPLVPRDLGVDVPLDVPHSAASSFDVLPVGSKASRRQGTVSPIATSPSVPADAIGEDKGTRWY